MVSNAPLIRVHLERMFQSHQFARAPRLRQLLKYLVESTLEGRAGEIKESLVGVEVFNRSPDYDPKSDPVVRVQVKRVRERLESYYAMAGGEDAVRIVLNRGSYVPQFTISPPAESTALIHRPKWRRSAALAIAAVSVILIFVQQRSFRTAAAPSPGLTIHFRPFTSLPGKEFDAEWSPDARQVAFAWTGRESGVPHLYLMRDAEAEPRRVSQAEAEELRPRWSPDGKRLAFYRRVATGEFSVIVFDLQTGNETTLDSIQFLADSASVRPGMDWSPDGNWLAVTDQESIAVPARIVLLALADGSRKPATNPPLSTGDVDVRFSPDGRRIAFQRGGFGQLYVQEIPLEPSTHERPVTAPGKGLRGMAWQDSQTLIYSSIAEDWGFSLARVNLSDGNPVRITPIGVEAEWPSYSRGTGKLLYTVRSRDVDLWKYSLADHVGQSVACSTRLEASPAISPDGKRIAFVSTRSGVPEVWASEADGSHPAQLTALSGRGLISHTTWSPDGAQIAFHARIEGNSDIYVVPAGGGETKRITAEGSREIFPSFSADGRSIYFMSDRTGRMEIFRCDVAGGPAQRVTQTGAIAARETPDGRLLIGQFDRTAKIWERALHEPLSRALIAEERGVAPAVTMQVYGDAVFYLSAPTGPKSESNLIAVSRKDGTKRILARLDSMPSILEMGFALTPDRGHVYVAREVMNSGDIFLAENVASPISEK